MASEEQAAQQKAVAEEVVDDSTPGIFPPHAVIIEQQLLGCLIYDFSAWEEVADALDSNDFFRVEHQVIYKTMQRLAITSNKSDPMLLANDLEKHGELDQVGGYRYFSELIDAAGSVANVKEYAKVVRACSVRRALIRAGKEITDIGGQPKELDNAEQMINAAENVLELIGRDSTGSTARRLSELFPEARQRLEDLIAGRYLDVKTGFTDLDNTLIGLRPGDLSILAARPSCGKTALSLNIAVNIAEAMIQRNEDPMRPVIFFSLEMPELDIVNRLFCQLGNIDSTNIFSGKLSDAECARIDDLGQQKLHELSIYINDEATSPSAIQAVVRRLSRELNAKPAIIIIDYLQLMDSDNKRLDRRLDMVTAITRALKLMAKHFDCPVLALSQLSRPPKETPGRMPQLSDLRDSGTIEQDADSVLFIHPTPKKEQNFSNTNDKGFIESDKFFLLVKKNRNGPVGQCTLSFNKKFLRFSSTSHAVDRSIPDDDAFYRSVESFS